MPRRVLEGDVVSNKTDKTITVLVERRFMHPMYKKYVKRTDKYSAHDENNAYQVGDRVQIIECRPISKTKRWTVVEGGEQALVKKKSVVKEDATAKAGAKDSKKTKPAKADKAEAKAKVEAKADDAPAEVKAEKKPAAKKKAPAKKAAAKKSEKKDK